MSFITLNRQTNVCSRRAISHMAFLLLRITWRAWPLDRFPTCLIEPKNRTCPPSPLSFFQISPGEEPASTYFKRPLSLVYDKSSRFSRDTCLERNTRRSPPHFSSFIARGHLPEVNLLSTSPHLLADLNPPPFPPASHPCRWLVIRCF